MDQTDCLRGTPVADGYENLTNTHSNYNHNNLAVFAKLMIPVVVVVLKHIHNHGGLDGDNDVGGGGGGGDDESFVLSMNQMISIMYNQYKHLIRRMMVAVDRYVDVHDAQQCRWMVDVDEIL